MHARDWGRSGQGSLPHRAPHHRRVHHAAPVIADADGARLAQIGHLRELVAAQALGDGGDRAQPRAAVGGSARDHRLGDRPRVVHRGGVRHRADRGEPAGRGRVEARGDVLFVLMARVAQVYVQVYEPGHDPEPRGVDLADAFSGDIPPRVLADARDTAALDDDVGDLVDAARGIEDAACAQDGGVHGDALRHRDYVRCAR